MKVIIIDQFHCEISNSNKAIEVSKEVLQQIGVSKCFDLKNNCVINYDNTSDIKKHNIIERIKELKGLLTSSDYKAIKYAEGCYTEEEYKPILEQRQAYRNEINQLEKLI